MTQTSTQISADLAAWESSTVQNLNSRLSDTGATQLWGAVLAFRKSRDVEAFASAARAVAAGSDVRARDATERAIAALIILTATAAQPVAAHQE